MPLKKQLGLLETFCVASGAMISSGLFILPALIYFEVGPAAIVVYFIAGLFFIPPLFAKTELATAMPKSGGDYYFIDRSLGSAIGTLGGLASWLSLALKSAFALVGIGAFISIVFPYISETQIKLVALIFCIVFTLLNIVSVKHTSKLQTYMVLVLIALLIFYFFRGIFFIEVQRYTPFYRADIKTFFGAIGMVFISFAGLTKVASIAEEIDNPVRNIPRAMFSSYIVVLFLYVAMVFVTIGIMNGSAFERSLTPLSIGGEVIAGTLGKVALSIAAILAFVSTANAGILSASRFPLAMSRDGLIPEFMSKISRRFSTPIYSIISTGLFIAVSIMFFDLKSLVKVASTMQIVLFVFVIGAALVMRESRILNYKPSFKTPFYPWIYIAGIILLLFLIFQMGVIALATSGIFFIVSILWYYIYVNHRADRKAAIIHIVERVIDKKLKSDSLSNELRNILSIRDEIEEDRFDKLVKRAIVLDINKPVSLEELFKLVADKLCNHIVCSTENIYKMLLEREKESPTTLRPGLAIPHITIEGQKRFEMVIVRSTEGIIFNSEQPPVYAVFVLIGSRDERNFHLQALSSIAQIIQNVNFDTDWLRAKHIDDLRDILYLAKRHRFTN